MQNLKEISDKDLQNHFIKSFFKDNNMSPEEVEAVHALYKERFGEEAFENDMFGLFDSDSVPRRGTNRIDSHL